MDGWIRLDCLASQSVHVPTKSVTWTCIKPDNVELIFLFVISSCTAVILLDLPLILLEILKPEITSKYFSFFCQSQSG